jgi:hypothetical protein
MADALNTADAVAKDSGSPTMVGNSDNWQLLSKFISGDKNLIVSTKAMEIEGLGCLVSVYRKENGVVTESISMCYGAKIVPDVNGGRRLVKAKRSLLQRIIGIFA